VITDSASPYSWWRRISSEPWIRSLSWSPQGNLLASCDHDAIWIYVLGKNEFIRWNYPVEQEMNSEYGTKYSPNGRELVVFAYGSYLWVLDARNGDVRRSVKLPSSPSRLFSSRLQPQQPTEGPAFYNIHDVAIKPQGDILACAGSDGQIMLYDYASLEPLQILVGHEPLTQGFPTRIDKIAFSHDGRRMASYGSDKRLVVWDVESWEPIREAIVDWFVSSGRRVIDWYPDGSRIVGCADDGTLQVWRL
jgi:WD40 repeat protein